VLATREPKSLVTLIKFIIKYIGDYRFTSTLIDVSNILLGKHSFIILYRGLGFALEGVSLKTRVQRLSPGEITHRLRVTHTGVCLFKIKFKKIRFTW
jgi:hypothetical protein